MERLEALLQEFYSSSADTERKRAIEAELVAFRDTPGAFQLALQALGAGDAAASSSSSPYLQYFRWVKAITAHTPLSFFLLSIQPCI